MALSDRMGRSRLERAGYVEYPGGPRCGNCEYADKARRFCEKWKAIVDLSDGCCDAWEAKGGGDDK